MKNSNNHELKSESWCLGGTYCDWPSETAIIEKEEKIDSFKEFETLIERTCPNITLKEYKYLYNECVKIKKYKKHDKYGGCVEYAYYSCDLDKLYNLLSKV